MRCINLGSYNYLGFSEDACGEAAAAARRYGLALASPRAELGDTPLHRELERTTAQFLGVEAAIVFGMGFATNSLVLPGLLGPGSLVLSDENNHASLILGLRLAHVTVRVFRHNDLQQLESLARAAIAEGRWERIVVVSVRPFVADRRGSRPRGLTGDVCRWWRACTAWRARSRPCALWWR